MGTKIKTWQIIQGKLNSIDTALKIISRQVPTRSGPIALLGIDKSGNMQGLSGIRRAK
jgi:RecB family endonuclease NucS